MGEFNNQYKHCLIPTSLTHWQTTCLMLKVSSAAEMQRHGSESLVNVINKTLLEATMVLVITFRNQDLIAHN